MNTLNAEETCDRVCPYLARMCSDMPAGQRRVFPLYELADKTLTSVRMLGKLRKRFKRALAQGMTPGRPLQYEIEEQSYFGRAAIVVRRLDA
jgi:hypothetical protein